MRGPTLPGAFLALLLAMAGLASPSEGAAGPVVAGSGPGGPKDAVRLVPTEPWDCGDVPSPGDGVFRSEPAYLPADEPHAAQRVMDSARGSLGGRLCVGRPDCARLMALIAPWRHGTGHGRVCALAVIERDVYDAWLLQVSPSRLLDPLIAAAQDLLTRLRGHGVRGGTPRFRLGLVHDDGAAGSDRGVELLQYIRVALQEAGAVCVLDAPQAGPPRLPNGVDFEVVGNLRSVSDDQVNVTLSARTRAPGGKKDLLEVTSPPFTAPAAVLGLGPTTNFLPPPKDEVGLSLWVDTGIGGSVCAGQRSQLWLRSDRRRYVRVIDLFGDQAILSFPNARHPRGVVEADRDMPLGGPEGFTVYPIGGDAERYLVLAAEREEDLGRFAAVTRECRFAPDVARALHRFERLPPRARVASTSYRIIEGPRCPPPASDVLTVSEAEAELAGLPVCRIE